MTYPESGTTFASLDLKTAEDAMTEIVAISPCRPENRLLLRSR
jgi:hypothetical protein